MRSLGMWLPILDYADGYGFTYGARMSFVDSLGPRSRISVPLTWGGERKAAVEVDRMFERGPVTRLGGIGVDLLAARTRSTSLAIPARAAAFEPSASSRPGCAREAGCAAHECDVRRHRGAAPRPRRRSSRSIPGPIRRFRAMPFTSVAGIEQLRFEGDRRGDARWTSDARGYVGLIRSSVLAAPRATVRASDPLPALRAAAAGWDVDAPRLRVWVSRRRQPCGDVRRGPGADHFAAAHRPVRREGVRRCRHGVCGGEKLRDQQFDQGIGGGVFVTATVFRAGLDVAWPQRGDQPNRAGTSGWE